MGYQEEVVALAERFAEAAIVYVYGCVAASLFLISTIFADCDGEGDYCNYLYYYLPVSLFKLFTDA